MGGSEGGAVMWGKGAASVCWVVVVVVPGQGRGRAEDERQRVGAGVTAAGGPNS